MKRILILSLILGTIPTAEAATRLTYLMNGQPTQIHWPSSAFPITFHVTSDLPARLPKAEELISHAFGAWQSVPDSAAHFRDGGRINATAGRDGKNAITIADRLYADSGFIAYTTHWFESDGRILESDIQIDATAATNGSNVEGLVQHEVGHFLGLDHSAVLSSVMFPFVGDEDLGGLDSDDRISIATIYPRKPLSELGAILRGQVRDFSGGIFGSQVVAMSGEGSPIATTLTDPAGNFELVGLPEGDYTLYAEPLDGPVESKNLSGIWRDGRSGFRTEFRSRPMITVRRGDVHEGLSLQIDGRPASLNPRWIGVFPQNSSDIPLAPMAAKIRSGETICVAVGGDGFLSGLTTFEMLNQGFTRVSDFQYGAHYVWATFEVAPQTPAASVVIRVANGDETAALTGAIRVERPADGRRRAVRP